MFRRWFKVAQRGGFVVGLCLNIGSAYLDSREAAGWDAWIWMVIGTALIVVSAMSIIISQHRQIETADDKRRSANELGAASLALQEFFHGRDLSEWPTLIDKTYEVVARVVGSHALAEMTAALRRATDDSVAQTRGVIDQRMVESQINLLNKYATELRNWR